MQSPKIVFLDVREEPNPRRWLQAETLKQWGYEVEFLTWDRSGLKPTYDSLSGISIRRVPLKAPIGNLSNMLHIPSLYHAMLRYLEVPDLCLHCCHLILLPLAIMLRWRRQYRVIYDACEFYIDSLFERTDIYGEYTKRYLDYLRPIMLKVENWMVKHTDGVLTIDSADNKLFSRYYSYNSNSAMLNNVPPLEIRNHIDSVLLKTVEDKYKGKRLFIYVGAILRIRGVLQAVKAVHLVHSQFPNVRMLLMGESADGSVEQINRYIFDHGLKDIIEVLPRKPYPEMFAYLRAAYAGLALHQPVDHFKQVSIGNGRKFFTYMSAGLPIIGPIFFEIGQVVKDEQCGILVDSTDPCAVANAMTILLEHPEKARVMGRRGRTAIEKKYNWEFESQKMRTVYLRAGIPLPNLPISN